ncbi:NAD(P)/FAD-dependent oxidoreductase [Candidatus Uhrbacteria bacterium]|nr:NAD(P)/FAD-dependent oxidoreductase [Candidatus Uhrbacteria bacterium]
METEKNIVILGAGFAGLRVALDLEHAGVQREGYHVVLVDHATHHLYTPLLYEVASVFLDGIPEKERFCMQQGVAVDLQGGALRQRLRHTRVIDGTVAGIDPKQHCALIEDHAPIPYEYCVVALGSVVEDFGIPGIREHAYFFKTMHDAMRIHERIHELVRRKEAGKEVLVSIVIGGGGPAGVELAGELVTFCRRTCKRFQLSQVDFTITIVEASNRLLASLDATLSVWARERLERFGVVVHLDTCVKAVKKGSVVIAPRPLRDGETADNLLCTIAHDKEEKIEADLFVWSGGIRASEVVKQMPFLHDVKGRIDAEGSLLVQGEERVFVAGDAAALIDPVTSRVVPALAQTSIHEGSLVARNIVHAIRNEPYEQYRFPFLAYVVPVAGKYAFAQFGRFHFRGRIVWFLHRLIDLKYFISILPFFSALALWWRGWKVYVQND